VRHLNTRQFEQNRLAAHLAATIGWMWLHALILLVLGVVVGTAMVPERSSQTRLRAIRRSGRAAPTTLAVQQQ
jgi:hypothetical protein